MQKRPEEMDTEQHFPEEIFAWLEGDTSPGVIAAVERWVGESAERRAGLDDFARAWSLGVAPSVAGSWADLEGRIEDLKFQSQAEETRLVTRRPVWRGAIRAAAVLLIGVGLGLLWPVVSGHIDTPSTALVEAPAGAQGIELELPGGVHLRLNAATKLSYAPSADVREVHLDGEAYFRVPDGTRRNLLVHTEAGTVRDLGTEFNVRARSGRTSVVVTEGKVSLQAPEGEVLLLAGQKSSVTLGSAPEPASAASLGPAIGWIDGRLVYYDERLDEVAAELERRHGIVIRVAPELRGLHLAVSIDAQTTPADAVRLVCQAVGATCVHREGEWRFLSGR